MAAVARGGGAVRGFVRRHAVVLVVLLPAVVLRVLTLLAYRPALLYIDSFRYLNALDLDPAAPQPIGYDLLVLKWLLPLGGMQGVAVLQHLAGLAMGVAIYALACRLGVRRWLAALAAVPVLLDAYQLQIEQNIMSDVWLQVLLVAALWVLLARGIPGPLRSGGAGVVLGLALITRMVAVTLVVPALLFLLLAGLSWRSWPSWLTAGKRVGAFLLGWVLIVGGYAGYFAANTGHFGFADVGGERLYGRTTVAADCATLRLPPELRQFCKPEPRGHPLGVDAYTYLVFNPFFHPDIPPGTTERELMHRFSSAVLNQQPLRVVGAAVRDFGKGFVDWSKASYPLDVAVERWQFQISYPVFDKNTDEATQRFDGIKPSSDPQLAHLLRSYQLHIGYTPGPLLGLAAVLGLLAATRRRWRAAGGRAALLVTVLGLVVLGTAAGFEFSWRYQLPGLVLFPLGGALGLAAMTTQLRRAPAAKPVKQRRKNRGLDPFPDDVDSAALADFSDRYGVPDLAPVVVVIAAYNEADGIGEVLDGLPKRCCDQDVDVVVVTDGCTDATAERALKHGAYTVVAPVNRGQGAALRLGYRVATRHGARFVVTTDADGQYDNEEMPLLLQPLLDGEADFVSGSRRLGSEQAADPMRWLGTRLFATLASVLTGRRITDTSFGFRGMRAELVASARLRQPQYQSSELMMVLLAGGARYAERPMTMRYRNAGKTKKGNNFSYGLRYAKAMTGTWLREYVWFTLFRPARAGRDER